MGSCVSRAGLASLVVSACSFTFLQRSTNQSHHTQLWPQLAPWQLEKWSKSTYEIFWERGGREKDNWSSLCCGCRSHHAIRKQSCQNRELIRTADVKENIHPAAVWDTYCWGSGVSVGTDGLLLFTGLWWTEDSSVLCMYVCLCVCMSVYMISTNTVWALSTRWASVSSSSMRHRWTLCVCVCVCGVRQRELVTLTLPLAAGTVAMAVFARGRGGKLAGPSSRGGDGWRGGDWLCAFYTNTHSQFTVSSRWSAQTAMTPAGYLHGCYQQTCPMTSGSLSSSGWSFLSFRNTAEQRWEQLCLSIKASAHLL